METSLRVAHSGGPSVSRCDGLFANGLQAANNLCLAIRGSLVADHQMQPLCLRAAAGRKSFLGPGTRPRFWAASPPPGRGQTGWMKAACWCCHGEHCEVPSVPWCTPHCGGRCSQRPAISHLVNLRPQGGRSVCFIIAASARSGMGESVR